MSFSRSRDPTDKTTKRQEQAARPSRCTLTLRACLATVTGVDAATLWCNLVLGTLADQQAPWRSRD